MAEKIVVTSGKGGVGKTTVVANLGIALANKGFRVCLIDVDFGLNNLDVVMGLESKVIYDLQDVLYGRCRIKQALVQDDARKNLFILPSGKIEASSSLSGQNIKLIIENISTSFDYILVDCPAGIDVGFHRAVSCVDKAIVVTVPSFTSLRDANKVITILKSYKLSDVSLVVNRARGDLILDNKMIYPSDIQRILKTELRGILPEEDAVFLNSAGKFPKRSESFVAYKLLAENIVKGNDKLFDVTCKYTGFIGSIKRSLRNIL